MRLSVAVLALPIFVICTAACAQSLSSADKVCPRPAAGATVEEPPSLTSRSGKLEVELSARSAPELGGSVRYCFVDSENHESPTLRVKPGDLVIVRLRNEMAPAKPSRDHAHRGMAMDEGCTTSMMNEFATNLHFHGLTIPPTCHQDDAVHTAIAPGDAPFEYRFRIPSDEPPGLYWYHPHIHGFGKAPMLGGASGAIVVEGTERLDPSLAGLPERTFIVRDRDLLNPNAPPAASEPVVPKFLIDRDGDAANNGTGFGKPAKDLTINYVPVPYPDYPPATITMRPGEQQVWRVLNASAITYVDLQVRFGHAAQKFRLVALDGVPKLDAKDESWQTHIALPPGARAEFVVTAPAAGETGLLVTRTVDTGPGGENDPNRALAKIVVSADTPESAFHLSSAPGTELQSTVQKEWLGEVAPVRIRRFYFSEKLENPADPTSAVEFYITQEGGTPKMFDMNDAASVTVEQGTVEDWIIENRSSELHDFHIHQLHFLLLDYNGHPVREDFLRDTVNVPYANGHALSYPSIRIRMDFRDPNTVGTFPYHCHLLEHEDRGMMGLVRVVPHGEMVSSRSKGDLATTSAR